MLMLMLVAKKNIHEQNLKEKKIRKIEQYS